MLPTGFRKVGERELPYSITFTGRLYGETELLAVAHAYQQATGHHLRHPALSSRLRLAPSAKPQAAAWNTSAIPCPEQSRVRIIFSSSPLSFRAT